MTIETRKAYLAAILPRYKNATKKVRGRILDEFCEVCRYTRKHAIRLLKAEMQSKQKQKRGPKPVYGEDVKRHLNILWVKMNYMCSIRMKAALPLWLDYYRPEDLTAETRAKLLGISSSSIDRLLKPFRKGPRGLSATKSGAFLKSQIPIELIDKHVQKPGYIEADTVAHCGNSLAGEFANTLTMTDLLSGWTSNRATLNKEADEILSKIKEIRSELPFKLIGFATDNGSEFINRSLVDYMSDKRHGSVQFVRRRPYKKNDAAHVEQKNDTHVRQLFGYSRIAHKDLVNLMNDIYRNYWNLLLNYFCPALKLVRKVRIGGKLKKFYDKPKTPYVRLLESGHLSELQIAKLKGDMALLNPLDLKNGLDVKLRIFSEYLNKLNGGLVNKSKDEAA